MKKSQLGFLVVAATMLLSGCSGEATVTATPVKNVDTVSVTSPEDIDVFCPTGICTFELSTSAPTKVTVTMHYDYSKLYTKIEGVSVVGKGAKDAKVVDEDQFTVELTKKNTPVKIEVIDFYRN
ncbi:hypothetical protein PMAL9190_00195 [Photobacterium malacitanum]|uniref:Uncharacterized protein n=1 Tax=Photobacterium malacitanum TaxID=2204294 RepID=A0A1Y6M5E6_9GAMM|nr:spore gernimation protein [Photobacterium malacitanum]SMY31784.1 hypothetical protein PMAL9190_00195 [Photobacterium malacitanum]